MEMNKNPREEKADILALFTLKITNQNEISKKLKFELGKFFTWAEENSIWQYFSNIFNYKISSALYSLQIQHESQWVNIYDMSLFYYYLLINSKKGEIKIKIFSKPNEYPQSYDNDILEENPIDMQPIKCINIHFKCAICHGDSNNDYLINILGNFYGPFIDKYKYYYAHFLCIFWLPRVCVKDRKFLNVVEEINRSKNCICSYCGKTGGGLGCIVSRCSETYHFKCVDNANCLIDKEKYVIYCQAHEDYYLNGNKYHIETQRIKCNRCGNMFRDKRLLGRLNEEQGCLEIGEDGEIDINHTKGGLMCKKCKREILSNNQPINSYSFQSNSI